MIEKANQSIDRHELDSKYSPAEAASRLLRDSAWN
jgi:hypothetical protein